MNTESFLEWQYHTLRKEIETSKDRQFKIGAGSLVIVPAVEILAIAVKESVHAGGHGMGFILAIPMLVLLLLLPIIVLVLHSLFFAEHLAISRCARYIREHIESAIPKVEGWEEWLGMTWLEERALSTKETLAYQCLQTLGLDLPIGSEQTGVRAKKRGDRAQESLQELAFRLLYISLYLIAAVSIVFVCVYLIGHLPKDLKGALPLSVVWIQVLVGLGLSLTYLLLWVIERRRVRAAMTQVSKHASSAEEEEGSEYRTPTHSAYRG
jgi:hypothetical protein